MCPRLPRILLKDLGKESSICVLVRLDSGQSDSESALILKRLEPVQRIRIVFGNKLKASLECHNDRGIHP